MKRHRVLKGLGMFLIALLASVLFGFVIEHLWNWLVPAIFGWRLITYWQAVGLFFLSRLLFGGFHRHSGHRRFGKQRMWQRWEQMSPEEREKCRAGMGSWGRRFHRQADPQA